MFFAINFDEGGINITKNCPNTFCFLPSNTSNSTTQMIWLNLVLVDTNPSHLLQGWNSMDHLTSNSNNIVNIHFFSIFLFRAFSNCPLDVNRIYLSYFFPMLYVDQTSWTLKSILSICFILTFYKFLTRLWKCSKKFLMIVSYAYHI